MAYHFNTFRMFRCISERPWVDLQSPGPRFGNGRTTVALRWDFELPNLFLCISKKKGGTTPEKYFQSLPRLHGFLLVNENHRKSAIESLRFWWEENVTTCVVHDFVFLWLIFMDAHLLSSAFEPRLSILWICRSNKKINLRVLMHHIEATAGTATCVMSRTDVEWGLSKNMNAHDSSCQDEIMADLSI